MLNLVLNLVQLYSRTAVDPYRPGICVHGCTAVLNLGLNLVLVLTSEIIHTKFSAGTGVVLQL